MDEAGRGPLAGPGAGRRGGVPARRARGARRAARRQQAADRGAARAAFAALREAAAREAEFAIAAASAAEIGRLNILRATIWRWPARWPGCPSPPDLALVDGNQPPPLPCPVRCVIGGDGLSLSIAAASILAKVMRDRAMARLDPRWPAYGCASHAGYPTARHRAALAGMGPARTTGAASARWIGRLLRLRLTRQLGVGDCLGAPRLGAATGRLKRIRPRPPRCGAAWPAGGAPQQQMTGVAWRPGAICRSTRSWSGTASN